MHPVRKQRLILVSLMVVLSSAAIGLVAFALRDNINLFYPPADVVAGKAPTDRSIRLGGMVATMPPSRICLLYTSPSPRD